MGPLQFYASSPLQSVRKLSRKSVKVYAWYSGAASALPSFYGPEIAGGKGNLRAKIEAEVRRTGREAADVAAEVGFLPWLTQRVCVHGLLDLTRVQWIDHAYSGFASHV